LGNHGGNAGLGGNGSGTEGDVMAKINGLTIDWKNVEGGLSLPKEFKGADTLVRLDVLKDWCGLLLAEYDRTLLEFREEGRKIRENRSR